MHIVRFVPPGEHDALVGALEDGTVRALRVGSVADLLRLSIDEIRTACSETVGTSFGVELVSLRTPIDRFTEVWAAGVTYKTSQYERIKESVSEAGIYERVYSADRPEIFFKATAWRAVGDGEPIAIRADSAINVPEPELAVVVNRDGDIVGYTACNDVSSRSIEGENPLYLPQAKIYLGSCAVGFGIRPAWEVPNPLDLAVRLEIARGGTRVWEGDASTSQLNRSLESLVECLFHSNAFPEGAVLSTGTCLVPELPFTLEVGDTTRIEIEFVGSLTNTVVIAGDAMGRVVDATFGDHNRPR